MQEILKEAMSKFNKLNLDSPTIVSQIQDWNIVIDTLKMELEKEALYRAKGALLRSKVKWAVKEEKNTKYFLNLEKSKAKQKTMMKVNTNGGILKDVKTILVEQAKYFKKLYKSNPEINFELKQDLGIAISTAQKEEMMQEISLDEIKYN